MWTRQTMKRGVLGLLFVLIAACRVAFCLEIVNGNPTLETIQQIHNAQTSIHAVTWKFTDKDIYHALMKALDRGVEVQLVVDEEAAHSRILNTLARNGAMIKKFIRFGQKNKMHAKFQIYDQRVAIAGSPNWSKSSGSNNIEIQFRITEADVLAQMEDYFHTIFEISDNVASRAEFYAIKLGYAHS